MGTVELYPNSVQCRHSGDYFNAVSMLKDSSVFMVNEQSIFINWDDCGIYSLMLVRAFWICLTLESGRSWQVQITQH